MANLLKIREICSEKKISLVSLSKKLGISQTGMQRILNDNTTKLDTLEKIASILEVPIWVFFDLEPEVVFKSDIERLKKENASLLERISNLISIQAENEQEKSDLEQEKASKDEIIKLQVEIYKEREERLKEKERLIEEKERTIKSYSTMLELYQSLVPGHSTEDKKG